MVHVTTQCISMSDVSNELLSKALGNSQLAGWLVGGSQMQNAMQAEDTVSCGFDIECV